MRCRTHPGQLSVTRDSKPHEVNEVNLAPVRAKGHELHTHNVTHPATHKVTQHTYTPPHTHQCMPKAMNCIHSVIYTYSHTPIHIFFFLFLFHQANDVQSSFVHHLACLPSEFNIHTYQHITSVYIQICIQGYIIA